MATAAGSPPVFHPSMRYVGPTGHYLYLLPALVFVGVFLLYPAGYTIYISLTDWDGLNPPNSSVCKTTEIFLKTPCFRPRSRTR